MMEHTRLIKVSTVSFSKKQKCLWPIFPNIVQTCILSSNLTIFFKHCSIAIGYLKQAKISTSFFKKILCRNKWVICVKFGTKLQHLISHDLPVLF